MHIRDGRRHLGQDELEPGDCDVVDVDEHEQALAELGDVVRVGRNDRRIVAAAQRQVGVLLAQHDRRVQLIASRCEAHGDPAAAVTGNPAGAARSMTSCRPSGIGRADLDGAAAFTVDLSERREVVAAVLEDDQLLFLPDDDGQRADPQVRSVRWLWRAQVAVRVDRRRGARPHADAPEVVDVQHSAGRRDRYLHAGAGEADRFSQFEPGELLLPDAQEQLRVLLRVEVVAGQRCRELDCLGVRVVGSSEHRDLASQRGDVALDDAVGALQVSGRAQCLDGLPRARAMVVVYRSSVERKDWVGAGVRGDPVQERRVVISPDQVERAVASYLG